MSVAIETPWGGRERDLPEGAGWSLPAKDEIEPAEGPFTLNFPIPPSVNDLFKNLDKGGRAKTTAYKRWIAEAKYALSSQKLYALNGDYTIELVFPRSGCDLGNLEKAPSDLLQTVGVIANDKRCQRIVLAWDHEADATRCILAPCASSRKKPCPSVSATSRGKRRISRRAS